MVQDFSLNRSAIQIQVQQRMDHAVKTVLPTLHQLTNLAADSPLSRTSDIDELEETLQHLTLALRRALALDSGPPSISCSQQPTTPPPPSRTRGTKRTERPSLLPPSPEAKQKRKQSHGTV